MPTIQDVRKKYPQYDDMSDQQLSDALYKKYYSDMPREQYDAKIGMGKPEVSKEIGVTEDVARTVGTTPNDFAASLLSAPKELVNIAGQIGSKFDSAVTSGIKAILPEAADRYLDDYSAKRDALAARPENKPGAAYDYFSNKLDPVLPRYEPQTGAGQATRLGLGLATMAPAAISARAPIAAQKMAQATTAARRALIESARTRRPSVTQRVAEPFTEAGAEKEAGRILRERATDPDAAIRSMEGYKSDVPGVQPTMGEASGDVGLAAFQRQGIQTGAGSVPLAEQLSANALAREQLLIGRERNIGNPAALERLAKQRIEKFDAGTKAIEGRAQGKIEQSARQIEDHAKRAQRVIGRQRDPSTVGDDIRNVAQGLYDDMKSVVGEAYNAPALQEVTPVIIPKSVFDSIVGRAERFYGDFGGEMPPALQKAISDLAEPGQNTRSLTNIDRRIADAGGELFAAGRIKEAAFARSLRSELGDFIRQAMTPEQRAAYENARQLRSKQGELFEEGQLASVLSKNEYGRYEAGSSRVADILFETKNSVEAAKQLKSAMGEERAEEAVRAWAANTFSRAIDENGNFNAKMFNQLRARYATLLAQFPRVRDDFRGVAKSRQIIDEYQDLLMGVAERVALRGSRTKANFEKTALGGFLGGKNPDDAIAQIMRSDRNVMRLAQLRNQIKGAPEAEAGLRQGILDFIRGRADIGQVDFQGNRALSQKRLGDTIKQYAPALEKSGVFTESQIRVMRVISDDIDRLTAAQSAATQRGSPTVANAEARGRIAAGARMLSKAPLIGGATRAAVSVYDALKTAQALKTKDQVENALTRAAQDPQFAALLMRRASNENTRLAKEALTKPLPRQGLAVVGGASTPARELKLPQSIQPLAAEGEEER